MTNHNFTLVLAPDHGLEDGTAVEALGEAGALDAVVSKIDGTWTVEFDREALTFADALKSAIRDVRSAGLVVRRVEPDDLITMSEVAERLGRSIESVRLLTTGQRGDGSFPEPAVRRMSRGHLWSWLQVATWAQRTPEEIDRAQWIAAMNAQLQFALFDTGKGREMLAELAKMIA
jgi:hypothetical protein